jgi:hypothetical protein
MSKGDNTKILAEDIIKKENEAMKYLMENGPNPFFLVASGHDLWEICHNKDRLCYKCAGECGYSEKKKQ